MDAEFAKRWVARLRDPSLKQTTGCLFDGEGYCCLGVAELEAGSTFVWDEDAVRYDDSEHEDGEIVGNYAVKEDLTRACDVLSLPTAIRIGMGNEANGRPRQCGSASVPIVIDGITYTTLAEANDRGCTFAQIADWIEQNWERL